MIYINLIRCLSSKKFVNYFGMYIYVNNFFELTISLLNNKAMKKLHNLYICTSNAFQRGDKFISFFLWQTSKYMQAKQIYFYILT